MSLRSSFVSIFRVSPILQHFPRHCLHSRCYHTSNNRQCNHHHHHHLPTATMDTAAAVQKLRAGGSANFPQEALKRDFAKKLDDQDSIKHLRNEFIIPSKASLKKKALDGTIPKTTPTTTTTTAETNGHVNGNGTSSSNGDSTTLEDPSIYFVGNSLGAQPKAVRRTIDAQLETWGSIGVNGHFSNLDNSPLVAWQNMAEDCARKSAAIVGASPEECVIMNTLTVNLHMMLASFYKPTEKRHEIILEWKPFPSDHYVIESQIQWHGLDPAKSMVQMQPDPETYLIPTERILATIDAHAETAALLLLPGIQYYSGQLFDIPRITAHAKSKGIVVGWDLAHAAGNAELKLHDWDVDFACWCTYKYMNAGPGSIAGAFVHERHGKVEFKENNKNNNKPEYRHRLTGWYGGDLSVRFNMDNKFLPTPGAAGFQVSNPSAVDLASLSGALSVFQKTDMQALRNKSLLLTAYAEFLLDDILAHEKAAGAAAGTAADPSFRIITPRNPTERGAQLSVLLLKDGLLEKVGGALKENGVVCDQRKPNVFRVAPVPLYCTFEETWTFMDILREALKN